MCDNIIEIKHLYKTFKDIKAINDISFKVKKGEFFAFLGINGAGKSTTISIMCGEEKKDSGEIYYNNLKLEDNLKDIRAKLGIVYQNNVLDKVLNVYDNLKLRASLYNITGKKFEEKYNTLSTLLDFKDLKKRTYGKLSGGQKRRIDIARALINDPEILILDEPTTGLDPQTRKLVWKVINDYRKEKNLTVFLTTHYMEEVVDSDYIVILNKGHIVCEGSPLELKNKYTGDFIYIYNIEESKIQSLNIKYEKVKNGFKIEVKNTKEATDLILKHQDLFIDYEIIKGKMDDVFLNATGTKLIGE